MAYEKTIYVAQTAVRTWERHLPNVNAQFNTSKTIHKAQKVGYVLLRITRSFSNSPLTDYVIKGTFP